ncbi:hypothetical protein SAMN05444920_117120 [Nonomuraea solani]|uniref:Uncharacterized protein n=1 Tax=Nonomuraea solani TaxID=1144553 RepID=A0A1H6EV06_9ACTN|nr:hypothetical protein [Nonomuraea solani]SEH00689.1 hypothetical protein SAMN05444920_117120 [Nonomuraea solani]
MAGEIPIREIAGRCLRALAAKGEPTSVAAIARRLDRDDSLVRRILKGERPIHPDFLRDLGLYAGVPVAELFHTMGWLPESELSAHELAALADEMGRAVGTLEKAEPYLAQLARPEPAAPLMAAQLLLDDPAAAERFEVRLSQVVSGERYRAATTTVAELEPRPGVGPLPEAELADLAAASALHWPRGPRDDFALIRLELRARTRRSLNNGQEYTWQGADGRTWRQAATDWPAHLLVQCAISGRQFPLGTVPWTCSEPRTIVMLGGRHGTGMAAALLAEALGWQFVLVRKNILVTRSGRIGAFPIDAVRSRNRSWMAVAEYIARRDAEREPWPAVVLVRPAAFVADSGELSEPEVRALLATPARIVTARPPMAYLRWWGRRIEGDYAPGRHDGESQSRRIAGHYDGLSRSMARARRPDGHDLFLRVPPPRGGLRAQVPHLPGELFDQTVRVAWATLSWLSEVTRTPIRPRTGRLRAWQAELQADPDAVLPRLSGPE